MPAKQLDRDCEENAGGIAFIIAVPADTQLAAGDDDDRATLKYAAQQMQASRRRDEHLRLRSSKNAERVSMVNTSMMGMMESLN